LPGPQSRRGTSPIETAPTAALPINVSTTRRERFMVAIPVSGQRAVSISCASGRKRKAAASRLRAGIQPPEKCPAKACANAPKPPRCTPLEPDSEAPEPEWLAADESPEEEVAEKKLLREELLPQPPWPPEEDPRGWHSVGAAIPGGVCWQLSLGISA
jgi:hypothetical protein